MNFKEYIEEAWGTHATNPVLVSSNLEHGFSLLEKSEQVGLLGNLIAHVQGEHLAQFAEGVQLIERLKAHPLAADKDMLFALNRFSAILNLTSNASHPLDHFNASDKVRILATVASAHAGLGNIKAAGSALNMAIQLADEVLKSDPSIRGLAIGSNNLACSISEKAELTSEEKELMLFSARTARKYWEIAGTWLEVERAEYRLAKCFLKAGDIISSIRHANLCLTICESNNAGPLELFFAFEAIAAVEKSMKQPLRSLPQMEKFYLLLPPEDQQWCKKSLEMIKT